MVVSLRLAPGRPVIGTYYEERCTKGKGAFGLVVDLRPRSLEAIRKKGRHFADVVSVFSKTGKLPVRECLLLWLFQTGQKIKRRLGL